MILEQLRTALADRYRLEQEIGEGGMATVYLAHDIKHDRDVAIKVLHPDLGAALGGERFLTEIRTTARLQHPHILPLLDSGDADGLLYYVMPLVTGETLRARLDRDRQLGIDEALRIAREVADALGYAHGQNVIHRDIKPENILLQDGHALVADFGIALAVQSAGGQRMTQTGLSLGTPQYMSPEQAMGERAIDARSDIYALGAVTYEMLAGEPPFTGSSVQAIVAKVMTERPSPIHVVRDTVPEHVEAAVMMALAKLPADRFASAETFTRAMATPGFTTAGVASTTRGKPTLASRGLIAGLAAALVVVSLVAGWALTRPTPTMSVIRYGLALTEEEQPDPAGFALITPDGSAIIYQGFTTGGLTQLWMKRRDQLAATPVPGSIAITSAALSPDGSTLAMVAGGQLMVSSLAGGGQRKVADQIGSSSRALTWLDDQTIAFVDRGQSRISTVRLDGTDRKEIWASDSASFSNLSPLPEGRGLMFQSCARPCSEANLKVLDLAKGQVHEIVHGAWSGELLATGDLLYVRGDFTGMAVPFDLGALTVRGEPVVVLDSISPSLGTFPYMAVSRSGTLVMRRGVSGETREFELVTVGRDGTVTAVDPSFTFRNTQYAGNYGWSVSPDGSRVAMGLSTGAGDDLWVKPLSGAPAARVTFGRGSESRPRWTRDGRSVTFVSEEGIFMRRADGTGRDSLLRAGAYDEALLSPDGSWLLFREGAKSAAAGYRDIFGIRPGADSSVEEIVVSQYDEMAIALSPDGKWLAYQSDETGILEVFIRPFPNTSEAKIPVSNGGGTGPLWSRDGRELFYITPDMRMMAVPIARPSAAEPVRPELGAPRALFRLEGGLATLNARYYTPWDVLPNGRFVMVRPVASENTAMDEGESLVVVENWLQELQTTMAR